MTDKQLKLLVFAIIFSGVLAGLGLMFSGGIYSVSYFRKEETGDILFLKYNRITGQSWTIRWNFNHIYPPVKLSLDR